MMPTNNQRDARAENNVLRAYGALFKALKLAGMDYGTDIYTLQTAFTGHKLMIDIRRKFRKQKKENNIGN